MAIALVGAATLVVSSGTFVTLTASSSPGRAADVIYLFGGSYNSATAVTSLGPTSNSAVAGSSFSQLLFSSTAVSGTIFGLWRRLQGPATSIFAFASAHTTGALGYGAVILRGVASTSPEDVTTVFTSGAGTAPQSPSVTPATPNSMLLSIVGQLNDSSGMTGPTGFSNVTVLTSTANATVRFTVGIATLITASTIATAPGAWTSTVSTDWHAVTVVVRAYVPPTSSTASTAMAIYGAAQAFSPMIAQ